jgi:hypothetical protein
MRGHYLDYLDYLGIDYNEDDLPMQYQHEYLHRYADSGYQRWMDAKEES